MANSKTASYSQEELAALSIIDMLKPGYRAKQFSELGLGKYGPDNEHIKSLAEKGLIKLQGGNVVLEKSKAKAVMKSNDPPAKYKKDLENWNMQFKTKGASLVDEFIAARVAARFASSR